MKSFLETLLEGGKKLRWNASRSTDVLRVSAEMGGVTITISHLVPRGHKDYIGVPITGIFSGGQAEGYNLRVSDRLKQYGRSSIIDDWFSEGCLFYEEVGEVFAKISRGLKFHMPGRENLNRLGKFQALSEVGGQLKEM
jgi:hypothetical protein